MNFRKLTDTEITTLKRNGCTADSWMTIDVARIGFTTDRLRDVTFSGSVQIGRNDQTFTTESGVQIESGIRHARIHNCMIGNDVVIENIGIHISNYTIGDNAFIRNIGKLETCGTARFGNGTMVTVLDEGGGREVMIYDHLSAQSAYIMTTYRNKPQVINKLQELIEDYANSVSSNMGYIGAHSRVENCGSITNFRCGEYAIVDGACELNNGTLNSCNIAHSTIGNGVIARDFIISTSTEVTSGAIIEKCFVGQGCEIGKQFSAENTLFFANCVAMHGEACSVFAGPYTVSHHKSTLLIATMFSFMNAGSGSNQSNHKYKLGAVHQGVCERGCKLGSDSYLLLPIKIGSFSTIMGRHYTHFDTTSLPFSYIVNDGHQSQIIPGVNLRNIGTYRDMTKWPKRDRRKGKLNDRIDFELFNLKVVTELINGINVLTSIESCNDSYYYANCKISESSRTKGLKLYRMALDIIIGHYASCSQLVNLSNKDLKWTDVAGSVMLTEDLNAILDKKYDHITNLESELYDYIPSNGGLNRVILEKLYGSEIPDHFTLLEKAKLAASELKSMVYADAQKEFCADAMIGYGLCGDQLSDFKSVRGDIESNTSLSDFDQFLNDYIGL